MAEKFLKCAVSSDLLALTAELIRTLRAVNGLEPGEYSIQRGGLILPDDLDAKKVKKDTKAEKKAEKEKAKAEKAEAEKAEAEEAEANELKEIEEPK